MHEAFTEDVRTNGGGKVWPDTPAAAAAGSTVTLEELGKRFLSKTEPASVFLLIAVVLEKAAAAKSSSKDGSSRSKSVFSLTS